MKTIEQKAAAYDKAVEKIKYVIEHGISPVLNKEDLLDIFPQLKESEDEKIRKALIEYFTAYPKDYYCELKKSHILAWLEKQGELFPIDKYETKFNIGDYVYCRLESDDALISNAAYQVYIQGGSNLLLNYTKINTDSIPQSQYNATYVRFACPKQYFAVDEDNLTLGGTIKLIIQRVSRETALEFYVKNLQQFVVEPSHITNAMLGDKIVSVSKLDDNIQETLDFSIKSYYVSPLNEFDLKIRVRQNSAVSNILFMTDLHFDAPGTTGYAPLINGIKNMLNVLRYFSKRSSINLFCLGGDYPQLNANVATKNDGIDNIGWMNEKLAGYNCPVMAITGNHEAHYSGAGGAGLVYQEAFNFIEKPCILKNKFGVDGQDNHVSWMDDDTAKIRYVFISVYDYAEIEEHKATILRVCQGKPTGYDVICFCHFVANALTLNTNVKNTVDYLKTNGESIIAWIAGHNHADAQWVYNDTLFISCLQSGYYTSEPSMDGVTYEHTAGTITESAAQLVKNLTRMAEETNNPQFVKQAKAVEKQVSEMRRSIDELERDNINKTDENKRKSKTISQLQTERLFLISDVTNDSKEFKSLQHHITHTSDFISEHILHAIESLDKGEYGKVKEELQCIEIENQKILTLSNFVSKAKFDTKTKKINDDIVNFVCEYINNLYLKTHKKLNIVIDKPSFKFIIRFVPIEMIILIDNLLNNSEKAEAQSVSIKWELENNKLIMHFLDDGHGINAEILPQIFDYRFSTTNGGGLGLYYAKEIIRKMKGSISVVNNKNLGVEFIISFQNRARGII